MAELNRLSCTRCKARKIRCSRVMPSCDRCASSNLECVYPQRVKRASAQSSNQAEVRTDALAVILDRLRRVEEQCTILPQTSPTPSGVVARTSVTQSPAIGHTTLSPETTPSQTTSPAASFAPEEPAHKSKHTTPSFCGPIDATKILKEAIDLVQRYVLQDISSSIITEGILIPPELAKKWIAGFFQFTPTEMLESFVDRRLLEVMPDIVSSPHVRIDAAVILVYYSILYDGCNYCAMNTNPEEIQHAKSIYLCCLRALPGWEREVTGTMVDLVAAMSLCRVAAEFFDYELSWRMFQYACGFVQDLGLHNIDAGSVIPSGDPSKWDQDRKGFWDLLHGDLLFRLIYNKPPSLSGSTWRVNLPWLDTHPPPGADSFSTVTFLVNSRLALVQLRFFELLDKTGVCDKQMLWRNTEALCQEILDLYEDWGMKRMLSESTGSNCLMYITAITAIAGYTAIIFMLRKTAILLDSDSPRPISSDIDMPDSPIGLQASRRILDLFGQLAKQYPWTGTMSAVFGGFQGNIAYGYMVRSILSDPDIASRREDIESLRRVSDCIHEIAGRERMFVPLMRAMSSLDNEIRRKGG